MAAIGNVFRTGLFALAVMIGSVLSAGAQDGLFAPGWTLQPEASSLRFQSVKNETKVESSGFVTYSGEIDPGGLATVRIKLDSVDTKIDLRNVRMRFLFFETFQFPEAVITVALDPTLLTDLPTVRRKSVRLPYTLDLHGVKKSFEADVTVTLIQDDMVAVSSTTPIAVSAEDFNLSGGVAKLEEAANVAIIPYGTVSFDFIFARNGSTAAPATTAPEPAANPASAALEAEGNLDIEACKGRFEIVSRSGSIFFASGSARLDPKSAPLLDSLAEIIARCPDLKIEVSGHTDADGGTNANQRLSEARAKSVAAYLTGKGIAADRFVAVGYGEAKPVVPNDTVENKARNRRIEFAVVNG